MKKVLLSTLFPTLVCILLIQSKSIAKTHLNELCQSVDKASFQIAKKLIPAK